MANVVANVTVNAGQTVGIFAATGATIAASTIQLNLPSDGSELVIVNTSGGTGAVFPLPSSLSVGASEVWVKNVSSVNTIVSVRVFSNA